MIEKICQDMQVVVLMGGLGTRLNSPLPKSLQDIYNLPFFQYQLEIMIQAGFNKFVFCVGYGAKEIEDYFGDGSSFGITIQYSNDGEQLLGTGGAIKKALPLLKDQFIVIYGDSFMDVNYFAVILKFLYSNKPALMTIMHNNNQFDKSNIVYSNKKIISYNKKHPRITMHYIDYGISIFNKYLFTQYNQDIFDLSDLQSHLADKQLLEAYEVYNRFYEIGTPNALKEFKQYAKQRWFTPHRAIFLDRDGVIDNIVWNDDVEQIDSPQRIEDVHIFPAAIQGLKKLQEQGYLLFIVTNQPAAAKGKTTYLQLCEVNDFIVQQLKEKDINIIDTEMCPHYEHKQIETGETFLIHPCDCRKPKSGMIFDLCNKYNIDITHSWMIGDAYTDIMCGRGAKVHTAFLGTYKCDNCSLLNYKKPNIICNDLNEFADILGG